MIFIADLIACSTCFRHHYAHHQKVEYYTGGCCLWYLVLWFSSCRYGVELSNWVLCVRFAGCCPQTGHITLSSTPYRQLENFWWWAKWCLKHVEQAIRSAKKSSVASIWHFISTYHSVVLSVSLFPLFIFPIPS